MLSRIKALWLIVEFVVTVLITIVLMYMFRDNNRSIRKAWAKMQEFIMGYNIKQIGEPDTEAQLLLFNHQSLVDIVIMEQIHPKDICWVAKQELEKIPLFGHIVNAPRMIAINRSDKRSIVKILKLSKDRISKGRPVAMFPEGTRGDGKKLLKFQSGGKILAEKLGLKVQPIVLVKTREIFDSQKMRAKAGDVTVVYLNSIDPASDEKWFENMKNEMEKVLQRELANHSSNR